jgi:hypothetical protein
MSARLDSKPSTRNYDKKHYHIVPLDSASDITTNSFSFSMSDEDSIVYQNKNNNNNKITSRKNNLLSTDVVVQQKSSKTTRSNLSSRSRNNEICEHLIQCLRGFSLEKPTKKPLEINQEEVIVDERDTQIEVKNSSDRFFDTLKAYKLSDNDQLRCGDDQKILLQNLSLNQNIFLNFEPSKSNISKYSHKLTIHTNRVSNRGSIQSEASRLDMHQLALKINEFNPFSGQCCEKNKNYKEANSSSYLTLTRQSGFLSEMSGSLSSDSSTKLNTRKPVLKHGMNDQDSISSFDYKVLKLNKSKPSDLFKKVINKDSGDSASSSLPSNTVTLASLNNAENHNCSSTSYNSVLSENKAKNSSKAETKSTSSKTSYDFVKYKPAPICRDENGRLILKINLPEDILKNNYQHK